MGSIFGVFVDIKLRKLVDNIFNEEHELGLFLGIHLQYDIDIGVAIFALDGNSDHKLPQDDRGFENI